MLVSSQPYTKQYIFPFWSLGTLIRVILLAICVALPFFLAYSTPSTYPCHSDFYLTSKLTTFDEIITYNYQYHIAITTSQG